ncbi:MAG: type II secretion system F family protein, partial [Patescibacteria group bacterium]
MPTFIYTAKSIDGQIKSGTVEAKDQTELAHTLRADGYILTSVEEDGVHHAARAGAFARLGSFRGVPLVERMIFTRNLAVMIGAGLALNRALTTLGEQTTNRKLKDIVSRIAEGVQEGKPFSECIAKYPAAFSELYVSMVRVGETAGNLEEVLNNLAEQMKKDHDIVSKVRGAMIYPGVIFVIMIMIGYLMMVLVVPKLADVFKDVGAELPASTKLIMLLSDIAINYWYAALAGVIGLVFGVRAALKTAVGKQAFDAFVLKAPIIKGLS